MKYMVLAQDASCNALCQEFDTDDDCLKVGLEIIKSSICDLIVNDHWDSVINCNIMTNRGDGYWTSLHARTLDVSREDWSIKIW